MANYAIITDLNRCTGCLACTVACKAINGVDVGNFWIKTLRIGPHPIEGGSGDYPDVEMYFLPVQCQHCKNPECVRVCPSGAFVKDDSAAPWDVLAHIGDACLARQKVECRVCGEACDVGAIRFRPTLGGVSQPELDNARCTGCGACVAPCPVCAIACRPASLASPVLLEAS